MTGRSRNWCFTLNNPKDNLLQTTCNPTFIVYALEIGESLTPHFQGYLETRNPCNLKQLKQHLPREIHLEIRKGTRGEAILYCLKNFLTHDKTKLDMPYENLSVDEIEPLGLYIRPRPDDINIFISKLQPSEHKKESTEKLWALKEMIEQGKSDQEIIDYDFPTWSKCYSALDRYRLLISPKRDWEMTIEVIYGPTGTGKSKYAMETYPNAYWKQKGPWWDGYSGEDTIIIDEYYGWMKYDFLLRLCDRYPLMVEFKGSQIQFTGKTIIFTTNQMPHEWYKTNTYFDSFIRRVKSWHFMPALGIHTIDSSYENFKLKNMNLLNNTRLLENIYIAQ